MDAARLLRPTRRTTRAIAALVVLALVGWLGVAAGHLHVHAGTTVHTHVAPGANGTPDGPGGDRAHPCSLCLSLDRGAGPVPPPAIVLALAPVAYELAAPATPFRSIDPISAYRSRAPPAIA